MRIYIKKDDEEDEYMYVGPRENSVIDYCNEIINSFKIEERMNLERMSLNLEDRKRGKNGEEKQKLNKKENKEER